MKILSVLAVLAGLLWPTAAVAQDTFVFVPDVPSGVRVSGCFLADRELYGATHFSFCLERRGTYSVRARGGVRCEGRLDWSVSGRHIDISLRRTSCNQGVAWEAATITCRAQSALGQIFNDMVGGIGPRVIVPDRPCRSARSAAPIIRLSAASGIEPSSPTASDSLDGGHRPPAASRASWNRLVGQAFLRHGL